MNIELDNAAFEQTLVSELEPSFEDKRKSSRRSTIRRVSKRRPKGQKVYSKSGKARLGRWVRV